MNTKVLVLAVVAACLTSGAAFAQSYDYRYDGYERGTQYQRGVQDSRYDRNGDGRVDRGYDRDGDGRVDRGDDRNGDGWVDRRLDRDGDGRVDYRHDRRRDDGREGYSAYHSGYAAGQTYSYGSNGSSYNYNYNNDYGNANRYQFRRGEYVASQYRDRRYVVTDWHSRNLYQPQYGYQWVQSGNNYAMVAIATGLIAAVLLNH